MEGRGSLRKTGSELTGARDLSRLSVLEENSWEEQEKGDSGQFFWGMFSTGQRGRSREKGGEKAKFSSRCTSSNSQVLLVPSSWNYQKTSGKENSTDLKGDGIKAGQIRALNSRDFPGFPPLWDSSPQPRRTRMDPAPNSLDF